MSIDDWRRKIDEIDKKLLALLNERTQCVIEIGKIKQELKLRVYDPDREREVLGNVCRSNHGPLDQDGVKRLFERIIDECRHIEKRAAETN
jgi:chorismate mutase-like protein